MEVQSTKALNGYDEPLVDGSYIDNDLGIGPRTRRNYRARQILPPPDTNLLGRDLWRLSRYRAFKADLLAGKFAIKRCLPQLRDSESSA